MSSTMIVNGHNQSQVSNGPDCLLLPYGYQIDLDFITYCEQLNNLDPSDGQLQRRNRRRQRQSREMMLGIQQQMQLQMDSNLAEMMEENKLNRIPPPPPPRAHLPESPIVPYYSQHPYTEPGNTNLYRKMFNNDESLNDVVHDFERTLERSNKKSRSVSEREFKQSDCIPNYNNKSTTVTTRVQTVEVNLRKHAPPFSFPDLKGNRIYGSAQCDTEFDGVSNRSDTSERTLTRKLRDLEEQTKQIPLLQLQIQTLRDERHQLQLQLKSEELKSASVSPQQPPSHMFQPCRISPVSLNSLDKHIKTIVRNPVKSIGTSTVNVLHRDVGCSPTVQPALPVKTFKTISIATDFILPVSRSCHDQLYTESDIQKAIEMSQLKMKRERMSQLVSVGTQFTFVNNRTVATTTMEVIVPKPVMNVTVIKPINIEPEVMSVTEKSSGISLKAITDFQNTRSQSFSLENTEMRPQKKARSVVTQTTSPTQQSISTQHAPTAETRSTQSTSTITSLACKGTDTGDLITSKNKQQNTEKPLIKEQACHTRDLIKCHDSSTNTHKEPVSEIRSTATNTDTILSKSIGLNCDIEIHKPAPKSLDDITTRIPRPNNFSPQGQRKFVRQNTFTVNKTSTKIPSPTSSSNYLQFGSLPPGGDFHSCPVEALLKLSIESQQSHHHVVRDEILKVNVVEKDPVEDEEDVKEDPVDVIDEKTEDFDDDIPENKMPMSPSVEFLDDDEDEYDDDDDDKFNDAQMPHAALPTRPPPTSISTIRLSQQDRVQIKPTKEMDGALKVLNDNIKKYPELNEHHIKNAKDIASCEWFQISSIDTANPLNVEDYLDYFEEFSYDLLCFMVNLSDKNGNTAMHYAVSHGNFDVVSILLDSKVTNINQTNNAGYTCVMLVSLAKLRIAEHRTVVQRLFQLSDVNIRATKNSQTALMLAVSHGNLDMVQMLIEAGADINIQDDDGSTSLMCAAEHGHIDIVKYLLAQPDCDSTKQDVDGSTALKISLEAGYHDIGCLLYAHEHLLRNKSTSGLKRTPSSMKSSTSSLL